jgi:hypothetical protein
MSTLLVRGFTCSYETGTKAFVSNTSQVPIIRKFTLLWIPRFQFDYLKSFPVRHSLSWKLTAPFPCLFLSYPQITPSWLGKPVLIHHKPFFRHFFPLSIPLNRSSLAIRFAPNESQSLISGCHPRRHEREKERSHKKARSPSPRFSLWLGRISLGK